MAVSQRATSRQGALEIGSEHVRNDIKRIMLLLAVVAVILVGLTLTSSRSNFLDKTGSSLSSFLKLQ